MNIKVGHAALSKAEMLSHQRVRRVPIEVRAVSAKRDPGTAESRNNGQELKTGAPLSPSPIQLDERCDLRP